MNLKVTQNIKKYNIKVTQSETIVKLQPILNTSDSSSFIEEDPVFKASEAFKFQNGDKRKLDEVVLNIDKKLDKPLDEVNSPDFFVGIDQNNKTFKVTKDNVVKNNKIENISLNGEILEIDQNKTVHIVVKSQGGDISNKLDKVSTITTESQVYGKNAQGDQVMINLSETGESNIIEEIKLNGVTQTPINKVVNLEVVAREYVLPQASSDLGGVKAQTTSESTYATPVKIKTDGYLYVPEIRTPQITTINTDVILSTGMNRNVISVEGTLNLTIPVDLGDVFQECGFDIISGSLTISLGTNVSVTGQYSLTFVAGEAFYLYKRDKNTNIYRIV